MTSFLKYSVFDKENIVRTTEPNTTARNPLFETKQYDCVIWLSDGKFP